MGDLLSKPKPVEEVMKENKKLIRGAIRELEREIKNNEREQAKLTKDIKAAAKKNEIPTVKIHIKDLIRSRSYLRRFIMMKTQLNSVSLQLQTMKSHEAMSSAMKGVTQCLKMMNEQISTPEMAQIMKEFERENERAAVQQDMMNDAIDGAMDEGNEEAEDSMFNQVMDELGIDFSTLVPQASGTAVQGQAPAQAAPIATPLGGAPSSGTDKNDKDGKDGGGDGGGGGAPNGGGGGDPAMSELEARLNNLRR